MSPLSAGRLTDYSALLGDQLVSSRDFHRWQSSFNAMDAKGREGIWNNCGALASRQRARPMRLRARVVLVELFVV